MFLMYFFMCMMISMFFFQTLLVLTLNILTKMEMKIFHFSSTMNFFFETENNCGVFSFLISLISGMIFLYSYFYLHENKLMKSFSNILMVFVLSMLILVNSESMLMYILGWDGLGVSSFLLVIFYSSLLATRSGLATFITNRLGDLFIILCMILLVQQNMMESISMLMHMKTNKIMMISYIFLILGCFTKSAQIPFSAWLPAAMAAPTPVSALVHSSTLVTAGLFLISKMLELTDIMMMMSKWLAFLTVMLSFMAGCMAFVETDLKKLVAMSTLSQMGLIGYIMFIKSKEISLFHVFSHATFKSLLFIIVGSLIVYNMGYQDIRVKSMPKKMMLMPMILFICSSMSLMGFIFTSGFFSKDSIILSLTSQGNNFLIYFIMIMSCVMTTCYTLKSFFLMFNNMQNSSSLKLMKMKKSLMNPALGLMMLTSIFGMFYFNEMLDSEEIILEQMNKIMGINIIFLGMLFTRMSWYPMLYTINDPTMMKSKDLKVFFLQMTNLNWISNNFFSSKISSMKIFILDTSWWEYATEILLTKKYFNSSKLKMSKKTSKFLFVSEIVMFLMLIMTMILIFNI